jgi:hypothetical protein
MSAALFHFATAVLLGAGDGASAAAGSRLEADFVDRLLETDAESEGVVPAPIADDAEFLRRVTLDLAGVAPTAEALAAFVADRDPDKRARRIDELLASEQGVARLARFLLETTTGSRATYVWFANLFEYQEWLKDSLRAGRTWADIVRDILTATGQTNVNGATNFAMFHRARPDRLVAGAAEAFLGASLACAECHDHPSRPWTREQFWGAAAFFARTSTYIVSNGDHGIAETRFGRLEMPRAETPELLPFAFKLEGHPAVEPRWLDGTPAASEDGLREQFAEFLIRDPAFARNLVNRAWRHLFGRAFAEPVQDVGDDVRHSELLAALSRWFVQHDHDLRALFRLLAGSRAYQRSCTGGTGDERLFVRALPRPLDVDQLFAILEQSAGISLAALDPAGAAPAGPMQRPPSRADLPSIAKEIEGIAPDPSARRPVLDPKELARIEKYKADEVVPRAVGGEPDTIGHALARRNLMQGICTRIAASAVARLGEPIDARHVEWLWCTLLSRRPSVEETAEAMELLDRSEVRRDRSLADLAWVLINSAEFSHNH